MIHKNNKQTRTRWWVLVVALAWALLWLYTRPYHYGQDAYSYDSTEVRLIGVDYFLYYVRIWQDRFVQCPLIIQICYGIIIFCVFSLLDMFFTMTGKIMARRKEAKMERKLTEKFYQPFKEVCQTKERLLSEEIRRRTDYDPNEVWSKAEMRIWIKLFIRLHTEMTEEDSEENFQNSLSVVGVIDYIDHELSYGPHSKKDFLLEDLMCLNGSVPESSYVNLANDKNPDTQRLAREAYILMSKDDPYRFFQDETERSVCLMAQMTIHWILEQRAKAGKINPSMLSVIGMQSCTPVVAYLIKEMGYFGDDDDMTHVEPYFKSSELKLRDAAFACMGNHKYAAAEQTMMNVFSLQSDQLQCTILDSVMRINSGRALDFLTQAYMTATVRDTRRAALRSMYMYGPKGRMAFERLKGEAAPHELLMFRHVEDKLINGEPDEQATINNIEEKIG